MKRFCYISLIPVFLFLNPGCLPSKKNTSEKNTNQKAVKQTPDTDLKLKSYFIDACREKIKGNYELAENLFRECLKLDPVNAAVNYEMANIYRYSGLYDPALKCAKIAALGDGKNEWYSLLYIDCLHAKRLYNEAITRYENLVSSNPYRPEFYQRLATEYMYAGKAEKAIQTYTKMEQKLGQNPEITINKVKLLKQLKKWPEAENELKNLISQDPHEARYYSYLAELYQEQGQPQKAMDTYNAILKTEPGNPYIHLALAYYYREQHKEAEFFKEVRTAFVSPDLDIDNKVKILESYYTISEQKNKYLDQAYELCKLLVDSNPQEYKAHAEYASFLYRDEKLQEARNEYLRALELDRSSFLLWKQLLPCEFRMGENDSLIKHGVEVMELFPNQSLGYLYNGIGYMRLKQYKKAIQPLKEGKQFVYEDIPEQVKFCSSLAEVYLNLEEYEKSNKEFDEALKLDPDNVEVLNNYAYYLSLRRENLDKAEKLSKHALYLRPNSSSYLDTYAWILFQEKKYPEAKLWLDKALEKGGYNRPAIVEHYGDVLFKLNEADKAVEYWKKSRDLGNNSDQLNKKISDKNYYE